MRRATFNAGLLAALTSVSAAAHAQAAATPRTMGGPALELPEPFHVVGALAELPSGRVLVSDFGDRRIVLIDFARRTAVDAAREGSGPREFRSAAPMIAAPGGEVWSWDLAQDRILVFDSTGAPRRTRPADMMGANAMMPMYVDRRGRLYGEFRGWTRPASGGGLVQAESTAVIRVDRGRSDTVALVRPLQGPHRTARDRGSLRVPGFGPQDAWGIFSDGTILVVRGESYAPELHRPDGSVSRAPAIPYTKVRVTEADRRARIEESKRLLDDARRSASDEQSARRLAAMKVVPPDRWEERKPAVRESAILVDSRDRAWVAVHEVAGAAGTRYDLLDKTGRRIDSVRLHQGERLIAFGRGTLYTTRRDDDGITYLKRYALP